jgi:tetratricopeptide (TPR) repeat protein
MMLVGQPTPSPALQQGLSYLALGLVAEGEKVVKKAALDMKAKHGSGSHPLAQAYADLARYHFRSGELERSAQEFQHASKGAMPTDPVQRQDRLSFMLGCGAALGELGKLEEAEKVLRQALVFARNLNGRQSPSACAALIPLADLLLKMEETAEAARLAFEAYDSLWKLGDPQIASAVGTRAEALKATGRTDNPFADLVHLPDEMISSAIANTLARAGKGNPVHVRAVFADLLSFVDKKYGDGHSTTSDTLAAIVHHEAAQANKADDRVRRTAVRRSVWSYAVRRVPGGLLANLEVAFEPGGTIHLAPHLTREADSAETAQLETVFNQAIDDLYARPMLQP